MLMCGRFNLINDPSELAIHFGVPLAQVVWPIPRYNIAPTQPVGAIVERNQKRAFDFFQWGLVPSWAKDRSMGNQIFNARSETLAEKPSFKAAYRYKRCLIPASGFYEWKAERGAKVPYYIRMKNQDPFAFAGLWSDWTASDGRVVLSCTIITSAPNELMRPIHPRMPVILEPRDYDLWLSTVQQNTIELEPLFKPHPPERMEAYPVSAAVNAPANDSEQLIAPISCAGHSAFLL